MNRRSFLAALPLVPAALAALGPKVEPAAIYSTEEMRARFMEGSLVRISGTHSGVDGLYRVAVAESPRDTSKARNSWAFSS